MGDNGFYALNASIVAKAGLGANATAVTTAWTDVVIRECECEINVTARRVFANTRANWSALPADTRELLTSVASDLAAIRVICYDMSGYNSRTDAEDLINVLRDSALRGMAILKEKKDQDFLIAGA